MAEQSTRTKVANALVDEGRNMTDTVYQESDSAITDKGLDLSLEKPQAPGAKAGLAVTMF